jgi:hypothetical protein
MGRPNIRGSAGPDMDVSTRRFKGRGMLSGRAGYSRPRASPTETFEEALKGLWNMWLRARRRIGGLLRGVLEEVMGS